MCSTWKLLDRTVKLFSWKVDFIVLNILFTATAIMASLDVGDMCPHIAMTSCPYITLESGEIVQLTPKAIPSDLDWLLGSDFMPSDIKIPSDAKKIYCAKPACVPGPCLHGGTCHESETGFNCSCSDGYRGERCEYEAFIHSLRLLGGENNEGRVAFTSRSASSALMLIHQETWTSNSSNLVCRYLGFEGVLATVSGALYSSSLADAYAEAVAVICPPNAENITECWHSETVVDRREESIAIVCCPVNPCNISGHPLGLESGSILDTAITSSGCNSISLCTQHARLNGLSAWIPSRSNPAKWIKIEFDSNYIVTAISTQGRPNIPDFVTSYTVASSIGNGQWTDYLNVYNGSVKVFAGNYDSDSLVTHRFLVPIVGSSIRINPKTYQGRSALRIELYGYGPLTDVIASVNYNAEFGCKPPVYGEGLGVEDGRIPNNKITASSVWDEVHKPYHGRLNNENVPNRGAAAWVPKTSDLAPWVKVDLGDDFSVTGIISQGRHDWDTWVTSLQILYSRDDFNWTFALEEKCGFRKTYAANFDHFTPVVILFPEAVTARYVRLHPLTHHKRNGMRFEILGIVE